MLLLIGAPGTREDGPILERIRAGFRLVVPTAESALRWRVRLARERGAVAWNAVESLSEFVTPWVPDFPEVTPQALSVIVMRALTARPPEEFARVAGQPGFAGRLAQTITDLSQAGCDCPRLAQMIESGIVATPQASAFLTLYLNVEKELLRRGWALPATRVRLAAEEIQVRGVETLHGVLFDGFLDLPEPELHLIDALRRRTEVAATLPAWEGSLEAADVLLHFGFRAQQWGGRSAPPPCARMVWARDPAEETGEIARRILELAAAGTLFEEMAIVAPGEGPYPALLRMALARAGTPARFHFEERLSDHPLVRYMTGAVEAMLGGWERQATVEVLQNPASGFGATEACDRLDHAAGERPSGQGLRPLREMSDDPGLHALLDRLGALVVWTALRQTPVQWAAALRDLRRLVRTPVLREETPRETAAAWRAQAAALEAFDSTLNEMAAAWGSSEPLPFQVFWRAASLALSETRWRPPCGPRNAVEVYDAAAPPPSGARVVFLCGLAENPGAARDGADPVLSEAARAALNAAGVPVKMIAGERRRIRTALLEAMGGVCAEAVLSAPRRDLSGERVRPLPWVEELGLPESAARAWPPSVSPRGRAHARALRDERLIESVRVQHESLRAPAIEVFLQCPFRFFLEHTLCLRGAPAETRPSEPFEERIIRRTVTESRGGAKAPEAVFERVFEDVRRQRQASPGCRMEVKRLRLWRDLERYLDAPVCLADSTTRCGDSVRLDLGGGAEVFGRIDRADVDEQKRAALFEFRYGGERSGTELAGALHLLGLARAGGLIPAGLFRCELHGEMRLDGWHTDLPGLENAGETCAAREMAQRLETALAAAQEAVQRIRSGVTGPSPADPRRCAFCEYADVCGPTPEPAAAEAVAPC